MFKTCALTEPRRPDTPSVGKRAEAQAATAEDDQDFGFPNGAHDMVFHSTWAWLYKRTDIWESYSPINTPSVLPTASGRKFWSGASMSPMLLL